MQQVPSPYAASRSPSEARQFDFREFAERGPSDGKVRRGSMVNLNLEACRDSPQPRATKGSEKLSQIREKLVDVVGNQQQLDKYYKIINNVLDDQRRSSHFRPKHAAVQQHEKRMSISNFYSVKQMQRNKQPHSRKPAKIDYESGVANLLRDTIEFRQRKPEPG